MAAICFICRKSFEDNADIYGTKCGHIFHHNCLFQWMNWNQECPQCEGNVSPTSVFKLYVNKAPSTDSAASTLDDLKNFKDDYLLLMQLGQRLETEKWDVVLKFVDELRDTTVQKENFKKQLEEYSSQCKREIAEVKERIDALREERKQKQLVFQDLLEKIKELKIENSDAIHIERKNQLLRKLVDKLEQKIKWLRFRRALERMAKKM